MIAVIITIMVLPMAYVRPVVSLLLDVTVTLLWILTNLGLQHSRQGDGGARN